MKISSKLTKHLYLISTPYTNSHSDIKGYSSISNVNGVRTRKRKNARRASGFRPPRAGSRSSRCTGKLRADTSGSSCSPMALERSLFANSHASGTQRYSILYSTPT